MATSQDVSILRILLELGEEDFKVFKVYLCEYKSIPWSQLDKADRADTSVKMKETYPETALEIIINILKDINRNDLVQRFSPTGSPTNGISYRPADNDVFHSPPLPGPAARWIAERREEIVSHMTEACLNQSLDALLARQLLMVEDYELVQGRPTRTAKVRQLLDTCGRHGEGFCRVVVRKLQDNRQLRLQPFPSGLCSPFHSETSR